jgi:hypothetical protein
MNVIKGGVIIILIVFSMSCRINRQNIKTGNNVEKKEYKLGDTIKLDSFILARENCSELVYSFCSSGYDDYIRPYPALVKLNLENFIKSYDEEVFLFTNFTLSDSLKKNRIDFKPPWELDELFVNYKNEPVKFFTNTKYKKKVKKEIQRNNLDIEFDGYFSYNLYEIKFYYFYGGKKELFLPNIYGKKSESNLILKNCDIFYITNIISIKPINYKPKY